MIFDRQALARRTCRLKVPSSPGAVPRANPPTSPPNEAPAFNRETHKSFLEHFYSGNILAVHDPARFRRKSGRPPKVPTQSDKQNPCSTVESGSLKPTRRPTKPKKPSRRCGRGFPCLSALSLPVRLWRLRRRAAPWRRRDRTPPPADRASSRRRACSCQTA